MKRATMLLAAGVLAAAPLGIWAGDAFQTGDPRHVGTTAASAPTSRPYKLTDQDEKRLLERLQEKRPEYHKRLMELRGRDPAGYRGALRSIWAWYQRHDALPERVQKAMADEQQAKGDIWRIVREMRHAADPAERETKLPELRAAVEKQFGAEVILREHRLTELEQHIKQLREELQQAREKREQVLKDRVEEWVKASTQPSREPEHHPPTRSSTNPS